MKNGNGYNVNSAPTFEVGIIESISPQGYGIYAVVRRKGDDVIDMELETVKINTGLFGNIFNLPETLVSLHEILIPLDMSTDISKFNYNVLIGREVKVELINDRPVMAYIAGTIGHARTIAPLHIIEARMISDTGDVASVEAIEYLKSKGYTNLDIIDLNQSYYEGLGVSGKIISYGDYVTQNKVSVSDGSKEADISKKVSLNSVTNLPEGRLKTKTCHLHIGAFSAK